MARRLFTALSVLSLTVCVGVACLWVRTSSEALQWDRIASTGLYDAAWRHHQLCIGSGRVGYITVFPGPNTSQRYLGPSRRFRTMTPDQFLYEHQMARFDPWTTGSLNSTATRDFWWHGVQYSWFADDLSDMAMQQVWLPFWLVTSSLLVLPLFWLAVRVRKCSRRKQGKCTSCGYSLTGNTSGVCPECGTPKTVGVKS